jgi:hypothetical protein
MDETRKTIRDPGSKETKDLRGYALNREMTTGNTQ